MKPKLSRGKLKSQLIHLPLPFSFGGFEILGDALVIGNVEHAARIAAGESPGLVEIRGDVDARPYLGFLEIELQGTTPVTEHDQLLVTSVGGSGGTINLDSSVLDVSLLETSPGVLYAPSAAEDRNDTSFDWFSIVQADTALNGVFEKVIMPEGWTIVYDRDDTYDSDAFLSHQPWVGNSKKEVVLVKQEISNYVIVDADPANNPSQNPYFSVETRVARTVASTVRVAQQREARKFEAAVVVIACRQWWAFLGPLVPSAHGQPGPGCPCQPLNVLATL